MKHLQSIANPPNRESTRQRWSQHMVRRHGASPHSLGTALTRRDFLKLVGLNTLAFGAALAFKGRAFAHGSGPRPIPGGIQPFGPGTTIYHVLLPGYPPAGSPDPAENDPSVITDFNGHVGMAFVQGTGTRTDRTSGQTTRNVFEVDLRFMQGAYIGEDGNRHLGTFALI
ncbi:MAG TPA: hypothetical protein VE136_00810 [Anaerolineales bacterium]|nr:hypothetical protein [Anaerolineales bacterium]